MSLLDSSQVDRFNYIFYMIHRKGLTVRDIYDEENGEHYIGSTRRTAHRRMIEHKKNYNLQHDEHHNYKLYKYIKDNGNFDNWECSVIEIHDNLTKKEAFMHEKWLIEIYKSQLNEIHPFTTHEERRQQCRKSYYKYHDKMKKRGRDNYIINKDKIKEQHRQNWKNNNVECREKQRKYRLQNRDHLNELQRLRRAKKQSINP